MRDCSAFNPEVRRWSWRKLRAWSDDLPRRDQLSRAVGGAVNDRAGGWQLWFSGRRASHGLRFFLMNQRAASSILKSKVKLGATASVAAGIVGRERTVATDAFLRADIISYSRARGLFAGVSVEGSTLRPDNRANRRLYGKAVSAKAIVLLGEVPPPSSALELLSVLNSKSPVNKSAGSSPQGR